MYRLPELKLNRTLKKIAVLTSGGDSPGMNSAIRGVALTALHHGIETFGIQRGYTGLISGQFEKLSSNRVLNISHLGGTILKSTRCPEFLHAESRKIAIEQLRALEIEALVVIGGDGSLTAAHLLSQESAIPVIGLPGTIDNDIFGTSDSIGFDTAMNTALDAIDRIRDTADSHNRHFLVEVMGRECGSLALHVGIAAGAEMTLLPEMPIDIEETAQQIRRNHENATESSGIIVVAEGAAPQVTDRLTQALKNLGLSPHASVLGHIQRGGTPSGHDRTLGACMGALAVKYLLTSFSNILIGIQDGQYTHIQLNDILNRRKSLDANLMNVASRLLK